MNRLMIVLSVIIVFLIGCSNIESEMHKQYIKQHGTDQRYYCNSDGFLIYEFFGKNYDTPSISLVKNDANIPTRCSNNVELKVKETVATGALSGSVN